MPDDVLDALADRDATDCFDLPGFCLPCGRCLAEPERYAPEPEPARHWDGPMPLSVKAGIGCALVWIVGVIAIAAGLVAAAAWAVG